ncbi:uncharacterized protein VTP21DRAFT_385 [Calcarisporiella thermophila]|uniref:uncharacterized protein n=1 Tax=Calcarisporiella thermophila TaxID=911321 RepID=UPI003743BBE6
MRPQLGTSAQPTSGIFEGSAASADNAHSDCHYCYDFSRFDSGFTLSFLSILFIVLLDMRFLNSSSTILVIFLGVRMSLFGWLRWGCGRSLLSSFLPGSHYLEAIGVRGCVRVDAFLSLSWRVFWRAYLHSVSFFPAVSAENGGPSPIENYLSIIDLDLSGHIFHGFWVLRYVEILRAHWWRPPMAKLEFDRLPCSHLDGAGAFIQIHPSNGDFAVTFSITNGLFYFYGSDRCCSPNRTVYIFSLFSVTPPLLSVKRDMLPSAMLFNRLILLHLLAVVVAGTTYKSYQGTMVCTTQHQIRRPTSTDEVQDIVREAIGKNLTVKAIANQHSITDVICTDGIPIDVKGLKGVTVSADKMTATIVAGEQLVDALEKLHAEGVTLNHFPVLGNVSMGGLLGTGSHGSSLVHSSMPSDYAVAVTLVDGNGDILKVTDADPDFDAIRCNLGLLGILTDITFKVTPSFKLRVTTTLEPDTILTDGRAYAEAKRYEFFEMFWYPSSKDVVVVRGERKGVEARGNDHTNFLPELPPPVRVAGGMGVELIQATKNKLALTALEQFTKLTLFKTVPGRQPFFSDDLNLFHHSPSTGFSHRMMTNACKEGMCGWSSPQLGVPFDVEQAISASSLSAAVDDIKSILRQEYAAFPAFGLWLRFSPATSSFLSAPHDRESVHLQIASFWRENYGRDPQMSVGVYLAIQQMLYDKYQARAHWGKNSAVWFTPAFLTDDRLPGRKNFLKAMARFDPRGTFENRFARRLKGISSQLTPSPGIKHCAITAFCICSKDSDCGSSLKCEKVDGYLTCRKKSPFDIIRS